MTSHTTTPLPSRRARRDAERAAQMQARVASGWSGVRRPRRGGRVSARSAALATLGGLAVGLPLTGLFGTGLTPASAAQPAVVPAAPQSVLQTLNEASASAELEGTARASALELDEAGVERARIVAASNSLPADTCAVPSAANGTAAAIAPGVQAPAVVNPLVAGTYSLSSAYGPRVHPIFGVGRMHEGDDYAAAPGTPIHAVAAGTVIHAGANIGQPGTLVVVEHELDGEVWTSWYLHMYAEDIAVAEGDTVAAGQLIGLVGSAGNSTGPHLHLEIHEGPGTGGAAVDPGAWLAERGAVDVADGQNC